MIHPGGPGAVVRRTVVATGRRRGPQAVRSCEHDGDGPHAGVLEESSSFRRAEWSSPVTARPANGAARRVAAHDAVPATTRARRPTAVQVPRPGDRVRRRTRCPRPRTPPLRLGARRPFVVTDPGADRGRLARRAAAAQLRAAGLHAAAVERRHAEPEGPRDRGRLRAYRGGRLRRRARHRRRLGDRRGEGRRAARRQRRHASSTTRASTGSRNPIPPLVMMPSTSGTGADVSQFCIVTDTERHTKITIMGRALVPDVSVIDPRLLVTMPDWLNAATGLDALTHGIEAFVSLAHGPLTDHHALQAVSLVNGNLAAHDDPPLRRPQPRAAMAQAALEAGLAFTNAILGATHAMSHQVGGMLDLPHGVVNGVLLPHVIRFNGADDARRGSSRSRRPWACDVAGRARPTRPSSMVADGGPPARPTRSACRRGLARARRRATRTCPGLAELTLGDACLTTNPRPAVGGRDRGACSGRRCDAPERPAPSDRRAVAPPAHARAASAGAAPGPRRAHRPALGQAALLPRVPDLRRAAAPGDPSRWSGSRRRWCAPRRAPRRWCGPSSRPRPTTSRRTGWSSRWSTASCRTRSRGTSCAGPTAPSGSTPTHVPGRGPQHVQARARRRPDDDAHDARRRHRQHLHVPIRLDGRAVGGFVAWTPAGPRDRRHRPLGAAHPGRPDRGGAAELRAARPLGPAARPHRPPGRRPASARNDELHGHPGRAGRGPAARGAGQRAAPDRPRAARQRHPVRAVRRHAHRAGAAPRSTTRGCAASSDTAKDLTRRAVEQLRSAIYALNDDDGTGDEDLPSMLRRLSSVHMPDELRVEVRIGGQAGGAAGASASSRCSGSPARRCSTRRCTPRRAGPWCGWPTAATAVRLTISDDGGGEPRGGAPQPARGERRRARPGSTAGW